jgi:hypothetical protein
MAIETQNGDYDLKTSAATVYNKTAAADHDLSLEIRFGDGTKNMNAGVGTITLVITNDGGTQEEVFYKGTQTRPIVPISKLHVASGKTITITALSSNSNDTDVDVTVTPRWEVIADANGKAGVPDTQKVDSSSMILAAEIATVTSQTVFTLATGSDQNDAYNQHEIVLFDDSNNDYTCRRTVLDYVGASKTVTIDAAPNFTLAADDSVKIFVVPSSKIKIIA